MGFNRCLKEERKGNEEKKKCGKRGEENGEERGRGENNC
jgi:hypothetical protein